MITNSMYIAKTNTIGNHSIRNLCLLLFMAIISSCATVPANKAAKDRESNIIFQGTIVALRSSTIPLAAGVDNTIVVKVDEVIEAPKLLGALKDKQITVQVEDVDQSRVGEQAVFYTKGWLLGDGIAVIEISRSTSEDVSSARKKVEETKILKKKKALKERISLADIIVTGSILKVSDPMPPGKDQIVTEHEPQWREAVLQVDKVLKGSTGDKELTLLFPGTMDVAWVGAPRFKANQTGIFLLKRVKDKNAVTALNPLDFHTKDQRDRITKLLQPQKK